MKLSAFIADNTQDAVRIVRENLGPEAVVISVRKLPQSGFSRLLNRGGGQIEVTACVPDKEEKVEKPAPRHAVPAEVDAYVPFENPSENDFSPTPRAARRWRSVQWLESLGLLPEFADRLELKLRARHGNNPPVMPIEEWEAVRDTLATFWRPPHPDTESSGRPHVFIGPAGSGKTTALCKWLTGAVLRGQQRARVWRLDGETANTSEFLSLHAEMVGVPVERFWNGAPNAGELMFIDLPGIETHSNAGMKALRELLQSLPAPHIHLVLNAAYETTLLFEQFNAFAPLLPEEIIFTHLDEEHRRVKLWNFVLGTNCSLGWLGGGQKIPGEFRRADSSLLFPHKIAR
jgi:flagellar biosynthesis protein FlhF